MFQQHLSFTPENYQLLLEQDQEKAMDEEAIPGDSDEYGQRYHVDLTIIRSRTRSTGGCTDRLDYRTKCETYCSINHDFYSESVMIKPELLDVVELLVELPNLDVQPGELGTIVEVYGIRENPQASPRAYEVEFVNDKGETVAMKALTPNQFVVVWKNKTRTWIPGRDRLIDMMEKLSDDQQEQIVNFTRSLYKTPAAAL
jgi:hypothetical protein